MSHFTLEAVYSLSEWVAVSLTAGVMGEGVGEFNVNSQNRSLTTLKFVYIQVYIHFPILNSYHLLDRVMGVIRGWKSSMSAL